MPLEPKPTTNAATAGGTTTNATSDVLLGKYRLGRLLGRGNFAKVYAARSLSDDSEVAIKIIDKSSIANNPTMEQQIIREVSAMRRLRHPNIIQIHEVMATKTKIYLVMDYASGGDLFTKLLKRRKFTEPIARFYFEHLVSTLHFCHLNGVTHRDIKPQNLLLDRDGNLKLSDFGLSALQEPAKDDRRLLLRTACGTPAYTAPEVFGRKEYSGPKADAWSCGVILFVFLTGYLPFDDSNLAVMYRKIRKREFEFPPWVSKPARRVISRLLDPNPEKRMSIEEVMGIVWLRRSVSVCDFRSVDLDSVLGADEEEGNVGDDLSLSSSSSSSSSITASSSSLSTNAFELISRSAGLNLSGLFEGKKKEEKKKFTSTAPAEKVLERVEETGGKLGYSVRRKKGRVIGLVKGSLVILIEVLEIAASLVLVDVKCVGEGVEVEDQGYWGDLRDGLGDIVVTWHSESATTAAA